MELLITILENILDVDEKVIIFTQYAQMGKIIEQLVSKKLKTNVLFLHGSLTQQKKAEVISNFQENKEFKILVATLKTGGVGLNLTAAQNVIHYDLWWNPAIENQATDRVHRIGQKSDVMVYRFITKGTLEEVIDQMSKNKLNLAEKAISNDETFITEMTNEELKEVSVSSLLVMLPFLPAYSQASICRRLSSISIMPAAVSHSDSLHSR